jgi:tetratricopeptide (TPR) repeat protein
LYYKRFFNPSATIFLAPGLQSFVNAYHNVGRRYIVLSSIRYFSQFIWFGKQQADLEIDVATAKRNNRKTNIKVPTTKKQKLGLASTSASIKDIKRALKVGQQHAERQEWAEAVKHLLVAWDAMPDDIPLLTVLAHALVQLGVREQAVAVLERALSLQSPTPDLIDVIQRLALEISMPETAIKLGRILIELAPDNAGYYVNLATAYSAEKRYDESIEMLQLALPRFPNDANLWNVLATQVRERDGVDAADVFFEEALRLNPNDFKIVSNYAISFTRRNQFDEALKYTLRAIELNPEASDPRLGAGQLQFMQGNMKDAWENYNFRWDIRRKANQTQHYTHKLPIWDGESLNGKTLFVAAEQGIGDEVMWGSYLPFLYEQVDQLIIGCDPRLVTLYRRRFPDAIVCAYVDRIVSGYRYRVFPYVEKQIADGELSVDFYIPVGSAAQFVWKSIEDVHCHPEPVLLPDLERVNEFESRLSTISKKPKIGIAWRSGLVTSERAYLYASIDKIAPLLELSDQVDFINLQYGDVEDELALAQEKYGVTIHHLDDINLKADIEANVALMSSCDIVVSSCSAPGMFAMSAGRTTLFMSGSMPWWCFGSDKKVAFARDAEFFTSGVTVDWPDIMKRVTNTVREKLELS